MTTINKFIFSCVFLSTMIVAALLTPGLVQAQYGCTYHSYQGCSGNSLFWFNSCGIQQDIIQICSNGCYNNSCNNYNYNNYSNYGNCTYHAYKLCVGNNIYWYSSCGIQQDLFTNCTSGQVCQYGQCTFSIITPVIPPVMPSYVVQYKTACYGNSLYWYDSLGVISGLYKNCADINSCTIDACSANQCSNTLKCDGTACAVGSSDYKNYCPEVAGTETVNQNSCGNGLCEPNLGELAANCPNDCKIGPIAPIDTAPNQTAAVSNTTTPSGPSGFWGFLNHWYLWILGALVLIFLFVMVFKRLSREV